MSRLNVQVQTSLLKEAKMYLKDVKPTSKINLEKKKDGVILTQDHIMEWLEIFYEDRVLMDTCNQARVRR